MGLDSYLYASFYAGNWRHSPEAEKEQAGAVLAALGLTPGVLPASSPHLEVFVCVAYWRKANAIHSWFVSNCQNGTDDCVKHYVSPDKLVELRGLAARAADLFDEGATIQAATLLRPRSGSFFGSTYADTWYRESLQHTVDQLDAILANPALAPQKCSLYYQSSW